MYFARDFFLSLFPPRRKCQSVRRQNIRCKSTSSGSAEPSCAINIEACIHREGGRDGPCKPRLLFRRWKPKMREKKRVEVPETGRVRRRMQRAPRGTGRWRELSSGWAGPLLQRIRKKARRSAAKGGSDDRSGRWT